MSDTDLDRMDGVISALSYELARPAFAKILSPTTVMPDSLVRDALDILCWAAVEIADLREDRRKAVQVALKLSEQIDTLEDRLADYEHDERMMEAHIDMTLGL